MPLCAALGLDSTLVEGTADEPVAAARRRQVVKDAGAR
jgi:hypothetical protein